MNKKSYKKKMRHGFSLIEIIIAIVVVGGIIAYIYNEVSSSKNQAEIKTILARDMQAISKAAGEWKTTSNTSNGTFLNIGAGQIASRLPAYMEYKSAANTISSSGWNGGCSYSLLSDTITQAGDSFSVTVDCSLASSQNAWSSRLKELVETSLEDLAHSLSIDKTAGHTGSTNANVGDAIIVLNRIVL